MMNRIGKCFSRPIKYDYLYVDNIKDNIDAILSFFKEQSGRDYKYDINQHIFSVHNADVKNDIYNFYTDNECYNDIIYMEDTACYIVYQCVSFDENIYDFGIYTLIEFDRIFANDFEERMI
ncbi:MAG: hypothetical protein EOL97_16430 [Spirochaetia bacterium]|nr:hypothetical protein [Spirochaetia bacterium]